MAKRLKLRDEPDVELPAQRRESSRAVARDRICSPAQFRVRLEGKVIVDLEDYYIDSKVREVYKILPQSIQRTIIVVVEQVYGPPGFRAL
jgi:hypothetical protein